MDLQPPCNIFSTSYHRSPSVFRQCSPSRNTASYAANKYRRSTTSSELQVSPEVPRSQRISVASSAPRHKVTVHDRQRDVVHEFYVPEDQYILHTAEAQDISLPFACRHGCCTSCAVRIKSGGLRQPEALGISAELKAKACCFSTSLPLFHSSFQMVMHSFVLVSQLLMLKLKHKMRMRFLSYNLFHPWLLQVYWLQFGRYFARGPIERDDYALELAMGDE
uniref:2Fe-2S ferredoxin-type domain-containing protein n=1 Tax=Lactuca sativa TaxID=4236 RepID=A0A9R1VBG3_LACSA|nr:hypothetical protein LSAT_V11C600328340 [Lactuca sativa]